MLRAWFGSCQTGLRSPSSFILLIVPRRYFCCGFILCVTDSRAKPQQTPSVEKHAHPPRLVYYAIYSTLNRFTKFRVLKFAYYKHSVCRHYVAPTYFSKGVYPVTLLPTPRRPVPSLGLGTTWVRQLRSGSCHYPTSDTKCNLWPSQATANPVGGKACSSTDGVCCGLARPFVTYV